MTLAIVRYTTMGMPVPDPDYPALNCGYDDVRSGLVILPADFDGDHFDPETTRSVEVVAEVATLGLDGVEAPFPSQAADDRMAAIRRALAAGNWELADAIDGNVRCPDCGGYVSGDGFTVDPDADCCARCEP